MLNLLRILRSSDDQGIKDLDSSLQEFMDSTPCKTLPQIADHMLEIGKELAAKQLLNFDNLKITLHKVKSKEWNVLLIRYKKGFRSYHTEIILSQEQTRLAL